MVSPLRHRGRLLARLGAGPRISEEQKSGVVGASQPGEIGGVGRGPGPKAAGKRGRLVQEKGGGRGEWRVAFPPSSCGLLRAGIVNVGREEGVEEKRARSLPPSRLFRTRRPLLGGREGGFARRRRKEERREGVSGGCCANARA